ncbi:MAG: Zn-dependent hydrolase, partial [Planctomycetes bacterium]|nr:Zn-dependent hydrolase [Planctomycetota bacterium]
TQEAGASLLERLAAVTQTPGAGVTRHSYTPEDAMARDIIREELRTLGLQSWTDWAGNLNALLPGRDAELGALVIGSHLDSVTHGGKYDGAVGGVGAV